MIKIFPIASLRTYKQIFPTPTETTMYVTEATSLNDKKEESLFLTSQSYRSAGSSKRKRLVDSQIFDELPLEKANELEEEAIGHLERFPR
ncbi:unnamed protein product [Didymodactylos carnosus]|uniref:Uncharacterized protein n=1 Tax=Didymodactylos carnosus TaxID=1234261 RepID=A0A816BFN1_9BILA|nr:unnamed protein product [Didymodactylos carnosus]CAF1609332.1 unnamed protein product [Didymodactylos carnosus]CAF4248655.1 unnamed protein product [Didymodactylos carnosus]CAF4491573.1 unnamed protein product [Didymodactylos carnosus]